MARRKTTVMRLLEREHGKDIRDIIADAYNRLGTTEKVAQELGVSRAAVVGWMQDLGITIRSVAEISAPQPSP